MFPVRVHQRDGHQSKAENDRTTNLRVALKIAEHCETSESKRRWTSVCDGAFDRASARYTQQTPQIRGNFE